MYAISTVDSLSSTVDDVRQYFSDSWLIYFLVYFVLVGTAYTTAMLSFFTTYYSTEELRVDFIFEPRQFVYLREMAAALGLSRNPSERWYMFKEAEMYLAGRAVHKLRILALGLS